MKKFLNKKGSMKNIFFIFLLAAMAHSSPSIANSDQCSTDSIADRFNNFQVDTYPKIGPSSPTPPPPQPVFERRTEAHVMSDLIKDTRKMGPVAAGIKAVFSSTTAE